MRKHYIDNIRSFCILLLFPYHTFMIYNSISSFYIHSRPIPSLTAFIFLCLPWFMPILFLLAGVSTSYALKKRSSKEYIKERILKLLIPLIFGLLILVPAQTYFAEKYHNGYTGGYFNQYILFFTKQTNLTGYNGGFTPAHLWFILYLFVIALLAVPIIKKHDSLNKKIDPTNWSIFKIISLFIYPLILAPVISFDNKSFGSSFALFILGYFVFSNDGVLKTLEKHKVKLILSTISLFALGFIIFILTGLTKGILFLVPYYFIQWMCLLSILSIAPKLLNFNNKLTTYLSKCSFSIYILHQTWLVTIAFYVLQYISLIFLQIPIIIVLSLVITFISYEVFKCFSITRFMFGISR